MKFDLLTYLECKWSIFRICYSQFHIVAVYKNVYVVLKVKFK